MRRSHRVKRRTRRHVHRVHRRHYRRTRFGFSGVLTVAVVVSLVFVLFIGYFDPTFFVGGSIPVSTPTPTPIVTPTPTPWNNGYGPTPTPTPTASPTPTPKPTPTPTPNGNSLVSITDGQWVCDSDWNFLPSASDNILYATTSSNQHNGALTFAVGYHYSANYPSNAADHLFIQISPGKTVTISSWIKTTGSASSTFGYYAAQGCDFYCNGGSTRITPSNYFDKNDVADNQVSYGHDWIFKSWTFVMPSSLEGDGGSGASTVSQIASGQWATPTGIVPWFGNGWGQPTVYFSDIQVTVSG